MSVDATALVRQMAVQAATDRHRFVLVLAGTRSWCHAEAQRLLAATGLEALWVGDRAPERASCCQGAAVHRFLGTEREAVVFDAWTGLDAEAFGAVCGSVRAGGGLFLLTPPPDLWPRHIDPENARVTVYPVDPAAVTRRFVDRFVRRLRMARQITFLEQGGELPEPPATESRTGPEAPVPAPCRTRDQQEAVAAIHRMLVDGRPLVLRSDRGRGKSAALGIAAAELMRTRPLRILVTAPRFDAVEILFSHAERLLPQGRRTSEGFRRGDAVLRFVPPDAMSQQQPEADLVLVDEAAAIPTQLLERMLVRYPRMVFATTVHGYEGTGRGFDVRFRRHLDARAPGWRLLNLETPVRWARGDPLEEFVFDALLLDATPASDELVRAALPEGCVIERLDRDALAADEPRLREIFGLLVLAHYRTSPLDLRHLLDGPNLRAYGMTYQGHLVAAALVAREGGFDAQLARASADGKRRPRGHLLPQSLAFHGGMDEAPLLLGDRIVRIAVHPAVQGRGLGTRLLRAVEAESTAQGVDYVGSSFGASHELLKFWLRAGFAPVRVGSTREAASGAHAVLVMRAISPAGGLLAAEATRRLKRDLPLLRADALRDLDPLVAALLTECLGQIAVPQEEIDARDWRLLAGFAWGHRDYETVLTPLVRLAHAGINEATPTAKEHSVLVAKVVDAMPWADVVAACGLAGRGDALRQLRTATARILTECKSPELIQEIERLHPPHAEETCGQSLRLNETTK